MFFVYDLHDADNDDDDDTHTHKLLIIKNTHQTCVNKTLQI